MNINSDRKAFELSFPVPLDVFFNESLSGYYDSIKSPVSEIYQAQWEAWQAARDQVDPDHIAGTSKMVPMTRVALRKMYHIGGSPCGVLIRTESGKVALVTDMGRVTWMETEFQAGNGAEGTTPTIKEVSALVDAVEHLNRSPINKIVSGSGLHRQMQESLVTRHTDHRPEKRQPCGCVLCTCENENQCQGCGAKFCESHAEDRQPTEGARP